MARKKDSERGARDTRDRRRMLWCKHCRQEFLTYRITGESNCPDCHRPCSGPPPRSARVKDADMSEYGKGGPGARAVRVVLALILIAALAFGAWSVYKDPQLVRNLRDRFLTPTANAPEANTPVGGEPMDVASDTTAAPPEVAPDSPAGDTP
jgi:hypothetical protein